MLNVLLISHYTQTAGVTDKMRSYLERHNNKVSYIFNPLYPDSNLLSKIGDGSKEITFKLYKNFQYPLEGIVCLLKYLKIMKGPRVDIAICFDPLSFLNVYLFKRFYKIRKLIYFNVDFSSRRFSNSVTNRIYLILNRFSYLKCDYFLTFTSEFSKNIDPEGKHISKLFQLRHFIRIENDDKNNTKIPNSLVYAGNLGYSVNFDNLFAALKEMKSHGKDFILDIYGDGDNKKILEQTVSESSLKGSVNFKGVVNNDILYKEILPCYMVGVCPYSINSNIMESNHMFNITDLSTKMVEYIGAGLPLITTKLSESFNVINSEKFGFLVNSVEDWYESIVSLLYDPDLFNYYQINARNYSNRYDEEKVITPVFKEISK